MKTEQAKFSFHRMGSCSAGLRALAVLALSMAVSAGFSQTQLAQPQDQQQPTNLNQVLTTTGTQDTSDQSGTLSTIPQTNRQNEIPNDTVMSGQRSLQGTNRTQDRLTQLEPKKPENPTQFQQMVISSTGRTLPIFGASIFAGHTPSTFAPVTNIPVTPDYVLGPGDELRMEIWGQVNERGLYIVDRTGAISLPQLGPIHVAGLRFDQVTEFLRGQLGHVYRNFDLNVNMGQLRSIQVFVVGAARRPGSYTISSLSTLLNALFASGGPLPQGSLRDIQVKRDGRTVVDFDLYDLLLRGDKSKDVPLSSGDVIFIPPVGPQAAVVGSIKNPAIYELRGESLQGLLELAGGFTTIAESSRVRLERIHAHQMRAFVDVDLSKSVTLLAQDGDIVTVDPIVDRFKDAVTLRGNVANPGRYAWHPGMRISDLIPNKDVLITRDYWQRRHQLGQMTPAYDPEPEVDADGVPVVHRSLLYPTTENANTLQDLSRTEQQQSANGTQAQTSSSAQAQYDDAQGLSTPPLPPQTPTNPAQNASRLGDSMNRRESTSTTTTGGSSVGSALTSSNGLFPVKTNVIMSAPDINWSYAVIDRQSGKDLKTSLLPFNLGKVVLDGDQSQNLELLPEDVITVFSTADLRVPTFEQTRFVILEGEFVGAGVYSVQPNETLRQLLRRAGGFTTEAYLYGSEFTRQSTKRVQKQRLEEYADQLEVQAATETAASSAQALNERDLAAANAATADTQFAIARLRRAEPSGRIVLQLKPDSQGVDSLPDLALEDGDRFVVPRIPSNVNVEGQVYSANAFVYRPGRRTVDYIREAGGPDRQADKKREFVLRADGAVISRQYGKFDKATVYPGDTVVVPPILQKRAILRNLVDIATIVGQFGLGLAAINVLK